MRSPVSEVVQEVAGILIIGLSPLWVGLFIFSQVVSAYVIPSQSMEGTLKVGDVVLAEKVSARLRLPLERGDIVLFQPPEELSRIVAESGTRLRGRDLFVKRVAGVAGDNVRLDDENGGQGILIDGSPFPPPALACPADPPAEGRQAPPAESQAGSGSVDAEVSQRVQALQDEGRISSAEAEALLRDVALPGATAEAVEAVRARAAARISSYPTQDQLVLGIAGVDHTREVSEDAVFVLGDCARASTDSRAWGELPASSVVARPFVRVWPPARIGTIEKTADLNPFRRSMAALRRDYISNCRINKCAELPH
jgi:signal peptidase I